LAVFIFPSQRDPSAGHACDLLGDLHLPLQMIEASHHHPVGLGDPVALMVKPRRVPVIREAAITLSVILVRM
jgi:hypothetical protein